MPPRTKRGGNRANSGPKEEARSRTRIFVNEDGQSIYFFLHKNIRDSGQRRVLREDIEKHSGKVILDQDAADVILVNPVMDTKALDTLRFSYNASDDAYKRRMYFEKASFVRHCVREGKYHHRLPPIKGMGGYVGRRRTDFTSNDDDHLCKFIARTLPDKASGGRTGDSVYKALVENATTTNELQWALRHPWRSWRERYKKNSEFFDPIITEIAREEGTLEKQLWRQDRRQSRAYRRRIQNTYDINQDEEEDEEEEDEEDAGETGSRDDDARESAEMDEGEFHYVVELDSDGQEMNSATKKNKRKRKRGSSSTPLSKPAKKPRPSKDSSSILDAKSKGKQRASEFEHVDSDQPQFGDANGGYELNALDDDFEFREPGPSFQRSPEQTLVENVSRARQATEPFPTQETLVDEGPSSHRVSAFNPISHSTSANRRHSAYTTRSPEGAIHVRSPTPPPPAQPRKSVESAASAYQQVRPVSPGANSPLLVEPPVIKPRPKPRPKKVVIRPVVEASPSLPRYEAPYRNTRSRSRSVEPSVQPPAKRRKAPKKKEPIQEESEPETVEERPETPQPELKLPTTETVEEEMDVENFLTNADDSNNSIQGGLVSERAASLETDDAQTRDDLFAAPLPLSIPQPPPLRAPSTVNRIRPQAALLAYEATRQRPRFSLPPPPRASVPLPKYTPEAQSRYGSRPRQSEPSPATFRLPEPRTPAYNAPRRAPSVSSDEPVPVPGTRASTIKKEKEDLEKHSPYRPPAGTRADMILRSM